MKAICAMIVLVGLLATRAAPPANAAAGDLDLTFAGFGTGGQVITTGVPMQGIPGSMTLQPDGKIVVAGDTGADLLVMRYLPNGALDRTFNGTGIATYSNGQYFLRGRGVVIQADGKIVIAGYIEDINGEVFPSTSCWFD
jgi:Domain of unknown function (DUF5122) beta-propeller